MDFIEFKLWKAALLLAVIAAYAFWRGFTGSAKAERRERPPE
jgi:hypothetical protein